MRYCCDVEMSEEKRLVILYGSQTGTAQEVAERIERDAIRRHLSVITQPLDQYDIVCFIRNNQFLCDVAIYVVPAVIFVSKLL